MTIAEARRIERAFYDNPRPSEDDLYKLVDFDADNFDLYDLYYLAKAPVRVRFYFDEIPQEWEVVAENGELVIRFNNSWYRTREDFLAKACINGLPLTHIYDALYGFEVLSYR